VSGRHVDPVALPLAERFRRLTGHPPEGLWRAPGRVNLIGEHTDYNAGLALPFAIDRHTTVALRRRSDRRARCYSTPELGEAEADLDRLHAHELAPWARYPIGVLWALEHLGGADIPGVDIVIESTVPSGAGLSSSAALAAAVAVALNDLCHFGLDRVQLAKHCHAAESGFVGAPVGMLDQLAVLCTQRGHGLLIDFRTLELVSLPLAIGPLVVVDTLVRHRNADGAYASRRRSCEDAAARLGVTELRDATVEAVAAGLDGELQRRARHVVTENARVLETARRLRAGTDIGDLLTESHASLRDDFQVSCPELDAVVNTALAHGASGARLTGAGLGGCAIVLGVDAARLAAALSERFRGAVQPTVFAVTASEGAAQLA
jgi:galactokinase